MRYIPLSVASVGLFEKKWTDASIKADSGEKIWRSSTGWRSWLRGNAARKSNRLVLWGRFGDFITASGSSDNELSRHGSIAGMKRERLFGGEAPLGFEAFSEIHSAELPIQRIPSGALALSIIGSAGDEPTVHHPYEEAVGQQPVPVGA
jgi:hypothetical protein